ncbi:carboxypeptidase-like regulatory domain-containing protein [Flavobacterium sp. N502536]|uniref:carboxypeptidase-like regulatory domain-containing protein n=1 Tax=Flavobacterium sp. N502536 TaxID=2986837 RepID=UPI0029CAADEB|nr:carboxypeptidase-like regulatory domain-containing protein [Flavobacterium sp. N502536]
MPLEAANIVIKGTTSNTTSDQNGKFSIDSKGKLPITLLIQYVGYKTTEIELVDLPSAPLQVTIKEENELIEVVVSSRRRIEKVQDVPIAISVITGKQAEQTELLT